MNRTDVIEREKYDLLKRQLADSWDRIDELDKLNGHMQEQINKAIEELQNMKVYGHTRTARLVSLPEVLDILKRNLGE